MLEIGPDPIRRSLDAPELREGSPPQVRGIARRDSGVDTTLEVAVEVLVWIQLGRIRRQKKDSNARSVALGPRRDLSGLVDSQIVEDQEDRSFASLNQAPQKAEQDVGAQGALVNHETDGALIGERGDHGQARSAHRDPKDRCLSPQRVSAMTRLVASDSGFVAPADLGPAFLGHSDNLRILDAQPSFDRDVVSLVGTSRRSLRRKPPAFEIQAHRSNRHRDIELRPEQLLDGSTGPQRERKPKLIWVAVADPAKRLGLLPRRQVSAVALRSAAPIDDGGEIRLLLELARQRHAVGTRVAGHCTDLDEGLALLAKGKNLGPELRSSLRAGATPIVMFHAQMISWPSHTVN